MGALAGTQPCARALGLGPARAGAAPRHAAACRRRVACQGEPEGAPQQPAERPSSPAPRPNPQQLRLQKVEKLGDEVWAGVAAVDRGEGDASTSRGKAALLVGGDLAALLLFTAIGRSNHGESLAPLALLQTAAPFLIGWFGAADLQKAFGSEAQGGDVAAAVRKAAAVWATGVPVGIAVRTAQRGYLPDASFVIVTFVVTFVFLVGWRAGLAAATTEQEAGAKGAKRRRDKQGNPLEFFQLLASLTKRW